MTTYETKICFRKREFKGSRLRCLLMSSQAPHKVAEFYTSLVAPYAIVTTRDLWAPRGFLEPDEARLGETPGFLSDADRDVLASWWLVNRRGANTPNWDLMSTCKIHDRAGLILVEAKSHEAELIDDKCESGNDENSKRIANALGEATVAWNKLMPGFALSSQSHYQLSNRFAFAWKVATMRVPVVLVYVGFLAAKEMQDDSRVLLESHAQWRRCVLARSTRTIPQAIWDRTLEIDGTPLTMLIRSAVVEIDARPEVLI